MATSRAQADKQYEQSLTAEPVSMTTAVRDKLRAPFQEQQIGKLPKPLKSRDDDKGRCEPHTRYSADGYYCGGWHARSLHLDFVGHAATTDRLLEVDPSWSWRPFTIEEIQALPPAMREAGLWIMLTIAGVTRPGFGDADGKSGGNAVKEAIGDAIRNAGMRFGIALDLWSKQDLSKGETTPDTPAQQPQEQQAQDPLSVARGGAWAAWKQSGGEPNPAAFKAAYEQWCAQPFQDASVDDFTRFAASLSESGQSS